MIKQFPQTILPTYRYSYEMITFIKQTIGIDLSLSGEAAYQNTRHLANAHVVQADVFALPFLSIFNYIFSIDVLHHLEDPQMGFSQLVNLSRKNGKISVWFYSKENNNWIVALMPVREHITTRLPKPMLLGISHLIEILLNILLKSIYRLVDEIKPGQKSNMYCLTMNTFIISAV
jgi:hypothetical protein